MNTRSYASACLTLLRANKPTLFLASTLPRRFTKQKGLPNEWWPLSLFVWWRQEYRMVRYTMGTEPGERFGLFDHWNPASINKKIYKCRHPTKLKNLVNRFQEHLEAYKSGKYNETHARRESARSRVGRIWVPLKICSLLPPTAPALGGRLRSRRSMILLSTLDYPRIGWAYN